MSLVKLATYAAATERGDILVRPFRQGSSIDKLAGDMMPPVRDWLSGYKSDREYIPVLVNALGASDFWGQNTNGDLFNWSALSHDCSAKCCQTHPFDSFVNYVIGPYGYKTFHIANPFVHHKNKDPSRAFGRVALSVLNDRMKRVELIVLVHRALASQYDAGHVVDALDRGEFPDVSMGAKVPYDRCTICGNLARDKPDYCACIKELGMGRILEDGRRIGVINDYPRFFDISFVWVGADKTGKTMAHLGPLVDMEKNASGDLWLPQSVRDAEKVYSFDVGMEKAANAGPWNNQDVGFGNVDLDPDSRRDKRRAMTADEAIRALWHTSVLQDPMAPKREFHNRIKAASVATKVYEVEGSPDVIDRLDKLLFLAQHLGGVGSSRTIKFPIDGDGPDSLKVLKGLEGKVPEKDAKPKYPDAKYPVSGSHISRLTEPAEFFASALRWEKKENTDPMRPARGTKGDPDKQASGDMLTFKLAKKLGYTDEEADRIAAMGPSGERFLEKSAAVAAQGLEAPPLRDKYPYQGKRTFNGLDVLVENVAGTWRVGKGWKTQMKYDYGELPGTSGSDGDPVDVYLGPNEDAENVYVVHQLHGAGPKKGQYDEDKVMLGFSTLTSARKAYLDHYDDIGPEILGSITEMPFSRFKKMVYQLDGKEKLASMGRQKCAEWVTPLRKTAAGVSDYKPEDGDKKQPSRDQLRRASVIRDLFDEARADGKSLEECKKYAMTHGPKDPRWYPRVGESEKTASDKSSADKLAEMLKTIGPEGGAVGRVAAALREQEELLPSSVLQELAKCPLRDTLSTASMMGIAFKPEEFQELMLRGSYCRPQMAARMRAGGLVFPISDEVEAPCARLQETDWDGRVMGYLLDYLPSRSYLSPMLAGRLNSLRIEVSPAGPNTSNPEEESKEVPAEEAALLSKVSAAYNWYRRAMVKVAAEGSQRVLARQPKLAFHVLGLSDEGLMMGKTAAVDASFLAPLAAAPLALMYSSAARSDIEAGKDVGFLRRIVADNPVLSSLAAAALAREVAKDKAVRDFVARTVA